MFHNLISIPWLHVVNSFINIATNIEFSAIIIKIRSMLHNTFTIVTVLTQLLHFVHKYNLIVCFLIQCQCILMQEFKII